MTGLGATAGVAGEAVPDGEAGHELVYHPLRISNVAALELGRTLIKKGKHHVIHIPAAEAKQHRPIEITLGSEVQSVLNPYLDVVRPLFPEGGTGNLKYWQRQRPELFRKRVYNHPGCDRYLICSSGKRRTATRR